MFWQERSETGSIGLALGSAEAPAVVGHVSH